MHERDRVSDRKREGTGVCDLKCSDQVLCLGKCSQGWPCSGAAVCSGKCAANGFHIKNTNAPVTFLMTMHSALL